MWCFILVLRSRQLKQNMTITATFYRFTIFELAGQSEH
jgi:hypothetical protein